MCITVLPLSPSSMSLLGEIPENNRPVPCLIPFLGAFFQMVKESSLKAQILKTIDPRRLDALIFIKNRYKMLGAGRQFLETVLIVSLVAFKIVVGSIRFTVLLAAMSTLLGACKELKMIRKNQKVREELQLTGFRRGMSVH